MGKITEEVRTMVEKKKLVFAATANKEGLPNVSPKGSIRYWDENHLIFVERNSARTIKNLKENPNISLVILDEEKAKGFQLKGQAELVDKGKTYEEVEKIEKARTPYRGPFNCVVKIAVVEVFPIPTPQAKA